MLYHSPSCVFVVWTMVQIQLHRYKSSIDLNKQPINVVLSLLRQLLFRNSSKKKKQGKYKQKTKHTKCHNKTIAFNKRQQDKTEKYHNYSVKQTNGHGMVARERMDVENEIKIDQHKKK